MEIPTQPKENLSAKRKKTRSHFAHCASHGYNPYILHCPACRTSFCEECFAESDSHLFCDKCGSALITTSMLPPLRRRSIATFLALAFGMTGAHNFYLGKTRSGVVQLVLTALVAGFAGLFSELPSIANGILGAYWFIIFIVCCLDSSVFKNETDVWGRPII